MYGMVNKALEDMIISQHGENVWERIKDAAGVDIDIFVSNEGYPDEITYNLIGAAHEILKLPVAEILEAFGTHWVLHTALEGYGDLMEAGGNTFLEFLLNLPNFHSRVKLIFPSLTPPCFVCTDIDNSSLRLHYYSRRNGLSRFVVGLVKGLGMMFSTPVQVELIMSLAAGDDHDVFQIDWVKTESP